MSLEVRRNAGRGLTLGYTGGVYSHGAVVLKAVS